MIDDREGKTWSQVGADRFHIHTESGTDHVVIKIMHF